MAQLEEIKGKSAGNVVNSGDRKKGSDGELVTYELLMKPETTRMEEKAALARFDKRLEALEKALGVSPESMVTHFQLIFADL